MKEEWREVVEGLRREGPGERLTNCQWIYAA